MSRLGDLIRTERLRSKMTPKQVARKCGVSESYLLAVEAGTKIIADDQARRILKTIKDFMYVIPWSPIFPN